MKRLAVIVVLLAAAAGARAESLHGTTQNHRILRATGDAMAEAIGRSLPLISASSGVTFTFDPTTGAFVRDTEVLGQLLLERARPIGRGRWNVNVSYQHVALDTFDGRDLDNLYDLGKPIREPDSGGVALFDVPRARVDLETNQVITSLTYGLSDDVELNLTIPVVQSRLAVNAMEAQLTGDLAHAQRASEGESAFGVGDIFLRGKYRFLTGDWGDLATGLILRAPAGSKDDFQGTGDWEVTPALYASTRQIPIGWKFRVQGYLNAGVDLNASDVDESEAQFGIGLDLAIADHVTFGVAFLAREPFQRLAPPGTFDVVRGGPGNASTAPLFGFDGGRKSYYDLAVGGRVSLWRDSLFAFGQVVIPLNDDGFRSDVIPLLGLEYAF